jgi:DNA polymerase III epsilon subunit-like protein
MSNVFIIDFETNGLNPYYNDVIELAVKSHNSDTSYQTLIKPIIDPSVPREGGIHCLVTERITELTGITNKMLIKEGIDPMEAFVNMMEYIIKNSNMDKSPIYLVAHNGNSFDFLFLKIMVRDFHRKNPKIDKSLKEKITQIISRFKYIDTVLLAKSLLKNERVSQKELCRKYKVKNNTEHRALGDVLALEKIFNHLVLSYQTKYNKENQSSINLMENLGILRFELLY